MTSTRFIRFVRMIGLAVVASACIFATAALAQSGDGRSPDTRDAASNVNAGTTAPDWFERYAIAHPYGAGISVNLDGRSADTLNAAFDARQASLIPADGRSPDTREAASAPRPIVLTQPTGFDWGDAGIGAAFAAGVLVLLGALAGGVAIHHRHHPHAI